MPVASLDCDEDELPPTLPPSAVELAPGTPPVIVK
jgi:hypothetical protein